MTQRQSMLGLVKEERRASYVQSYCVLLSLGTEYPVVAAACQTRFLVHMVFFSGAGAPILGLAHAKEKTHELCSLLVLHSEQS